MKVISCSSFFASIRISPLSSHLLLIRMKHFINHHPWSADWDARTQRGTRSSAPPHLNISIFLQMQSNRFVDGTDDCEMVGQRAQQQRITSLSLSDDKCWCTWLLKGNGRRLSACFDLSSTQKTLIPPLYTALCIQIIRHLTLTMVLNTHALRFNACFIEHLNRVLYLSEDKYVCILKRCYGL